MTLINEILDLAKIESGTMAVEFGAVRFANLRDYVDQTFRQVAEEKGLAFSGRARRRRCRRRIETDDMRLRQVLRNLLSNAIKFTERGSVAVNPLRLIPTERDNQVLNAPRGRRLLRQRTPASASRRTSSG